jgi:putative membrane-bound dehydrogenase-like protein
MQLPAGFEVGVVAFEPLVRQPVAIEFDDRGRMWVIQYLQYPNPAGLKRVAVDRFSRTKYDRVPEPPPHGPRGADRITILEDTDSDGRMDRGRDFVDGLNLATGLAFGHGGVFVLNVPYLLFYPDYNRDDVPDGDPEVLLTGFGMEDAHSVANSLTWGPDGWLYGCQGSTVTANIRGVEFQQGVWRYHPQSREFELFCEGGGNSWGLDFDRVGRLFYSTNYGGHVLLHGVQGGYFVKSFGKHGALHNPHAYGFFDHATHQNFRGGHVTVGGIVYQGDTFPPAFRDMYIAADLLGHGVYWHSVNPRGSSVQTAHGGELLIANDSWFAPTDVSLGPDGAVYVSDWQDARTAHPDPDAEWDRSNGRIFRIAAKETQQVPKINFALLSIEELKRLHQHRSQWYVRRARQEFVRRYRKTEPPTGALASELAELRRDFGATARSSEQEIEALEALWTLHALGGFDEAIASELLDRALPALRAWTVRMLGDKRTLSNRMAHRLGELAKNEPEIAVRQQLACSAARFPAHFAMPIISANMVRDLALDRKDLYLPLLWWWAVERHSVNSREEVLRHFIQPGIWKSLMVRDVLLPRLIRRYAAEGTDEGLAAVTRLMKSAPTDSDRASLWRPILLGCQERPRVARGDGWPKQVRQSEFSRLLLSDWRAAPTDTTLLLICVELRDPQALALAQHDAFFSATDARRRVELLEILSQVAEPYYMTPAMALLSNSQPESVQAAALQVIAQLDEPGMAARLIDCHELLASKKIKAQIRALLFGRVSSARAWLAAVARGDIGEDSTSIEELRQVALLGDPELDALVAKHWGKIQGGTREEKHAEVRRLNNDLRAAHGDRKVGRGVFEKHCAACHQLFGEGTKVGPDLTTSNRQDRDFLLASLVDPSSVIRKEYVGVVIQTRSGRVVTGLPIARSDSSITLAEASGNQQVIALAEIQELDDSPLSLMPEDLYRQLKPQELRDLFAYIQAKD